jgi:hypothetical protein
LDTPDLWPLLPRAESMVEANTLITMGTHWIDDMVVSAWPNDSPCTGIVSIE